LKLISSPFSACGISPPGVYWGAQVERQLMGPMLPSPLNVCTDLWQWSTGQPCPILPCCPPQVPGVHAHARLANAHRHQQTCSAHTAGSPVCLASLGRAGKGVTERPVERAGVLGGVRHDRNVGVALAAQVTSTSCEGGGHQHAMQLITADKRARAWTQPTCSTKPETVDSSSNQAAQLPSNQQPSCPKHQEDKRPGRRLAINAYQQRPITKG
jgi:hypothetical protein